MIVKKVEEKEENSNAPPPFITSTLQQEAYNRCGFIPERTMKLAQELYEGIELSGSSDINGNLSAQKTIKIDGNTKIEGNAVGENILFGASEGDKKKQHYQIHGSILAKNAVEVHKTHVEGDIKGKDVTI